MLVSAPVERHAGDLLIPEAHHRKRRRRLMIALAVMLVMACALGFLAIVRDHHAASPPMSHPGPASLIAPSVGYVSGYVAVCAGPPSVLPRRATVRLVQNGKVVAKAAVVAGDPARDRYRLRVAPGRYHIEATNWRGTSRTVTVLANKATTADFPNYCE